MELIDKIGVAFIAIFILRILINNLILNKRDKTSYFVFFLPPFSSEAFQFGLECMFAFYWKRKEADTHTLEILKLFANFLSFSVIVCVVSMIILSRFL